MNPTGPPTAAPGGAPPMGAWYPNGPWHPPPAWNGNPPFLPPPPPPVYGAYAAPAPSGFAPVVLPGYLTHHDPQQYQQPQQHGHWDWVWHPAPSQRERTVNDTAGIAGRPSGKRPRSSIAATSVAEDNALASRLAQDLVDSVVGCVADTTDLFGLLRLRTVCSTWAKAVRAVSSDGRFRDWIHFNAKLFQNASRDEDPRFGNRSRFRRERTALRLQFVVWRNCDEVRLSLNHRKDCVSFERLVGPIGRYAARVGGQLPPLSPLRTLGPTITRLDLANSAKQAVNNDTILRLAALLPALRGLGVRNCHAVGDINAFSRHGLTQLDISGHHCGVGTEGLSKLFYIKKLDASGRKPVCLDHIAGRLTELHIAARRPEDGAYVAFASDKPPSDHAPALLSSHKCMMQRLRKLSVTDGTSFSGRILDVTPALTDLTLGDSFNVSGNHPAIMIPPGLPLRRLDLGGLINVRIHGIRGCGDTLTELDVTSCNEVFNHHLVGLHKLKVLNVTDSQISSISPVVDTLTELTARGDTTMITDASLTEARQLRKLDVSDNPHVSSITPFAETLTELHAGGATGLAGVDLGTAPQLTALSVTEFDCAMGDENLKRCTTLTCLNCADNDKVTTIRPFMDTLERLEGGDHIPKSELGAAPRLTYVN